MTEPRNKKRAAWERAMRFWNSRTPEETAAEEAEMERIRRRYYNDPEFRARCEATEAEWDHQIDPGIY